MKKTHLVFLFVIFTLSGCAATKQINFNSQEDIKNNVSIQRDEFKKVTFINGPRFSSYSGVDKSDVIDQIALDATVMDKTNSIIYSIFVRDTFSFRWRNYSEAYDNEGEKLPLLKTGSNVWCYSGCTFEEFLDIPVPRDYLEKHQDSGVRIKISGSGGEVIFMIPPQYIAGFLKAVPKRYE